MRRFLSTRLWVFGLLMLALVAHIRGNDDLGASAATFAVVLVITRIALALLRFVGRMRHGGEPRARVTVRAPWGRRDADLAGCFRRLDPAWQQWLNSDRTIPAKGNHSGK